MLPTSLIPINIYFLKYCNILFLVYTVLHCYLLQGLLYFKIFVFLFSYESDANTQATIILMPVSHPVISTSPLSALIIFQAAQLNSVLVLTA